MNGGSTYKTRPAEQGLRSIVSILIGAHYLNNVEKKKIGQGKEGKRKRPTGRASS
jgi:hypothetical protein